jgi:AcrR family transcriptional regulator
MANEPGLRERKKQEVRSRIVRCAAALFARDGYENVSVAQVAGAADVSQQTVYNYFATKEHLVLDQEDDLRAVLVEVISTTPRGSSPAESMRAPALAFVASIASMSTEEVIGGLGCLAATSPTVRRLSLDMTDRNADAVAAALAVTDGTAVTANHKLRAIPLVWIFQLITDEVGQRALARQRPADIAVELAVVVESLVDELAARDH